MIYLSGFRFPDRAQEANYMAFSPRARQTCYDSYYPFGLFEGRTLPELDFLEITILYGGNGSGKTTLLNVMADALRLYRRAEYNRTPFFDDYARLCEPRTARPIPTGSMILTSDDVFDYMLDLRALNDGVDTRREQMFADYNDLRRERFQMHGMKDYDRLKQVSAARRYSQSQMARRTLPANVRTRSNGESALAVFSERIREDALYLLDEPENSLSTESQKKLAEYIEKELDGRLDLLYAESLGCGPAVFLKASPTVQIDRMILSGPEYLDFGVLNRLILKVMPQKQYRTAHEKYMPAWALRFMGQTEQGMQTMLRRIPDHISLESVRATWEAGLYLYRTDFLVQPDAKVACWYGEKEGHMKKAIQRLRTAYPSLIVRCFPGFGHGEIINHPALLVSEMEHFLADGKTVADAQQN